MSICTATLLPEYTNFLVLREKERGTSLFTNRPFSRSFYFTNVSFTATNSNVRIRYKFIFSLLPSRYAKPEHDFYS